MTTSAPPPTPAAEAASAPAEPDELSPDELRERTFDGVRWFTLTRGAAESTLILSAVVLARLISPAQFGHLAVAIVVNEFANCIAAETIGTPLIQRPHLTPAHLQAAACLAMMIGVGLALLTLFVVPLVTAPLFGSQTTSLFRLFGLAFALTGLQIVPLAQLSRGLRFRHIGIVEVVGVLVSSAVAVGLAFAGFGAKSYVLGVLAGLLICTLGYIKGAGFVVPRWRPHEMRQLLQFGGPASAAGIAGVAYRNIDYLVLGARMPALAVGFYYRAFTVGVEYERRLSGIISRLALPVYSRASDAAHRLQLRTRITRSNASVTFPLLVLFIIFAPRLIPWLFGQRWEPAVLPAQILAVGGMASTLRSLTGPSMLAAAEPKSLFLFSVAETLLYGSTVWVAASGGLTVVCLSVAGFQVASVLIAYMVMMHRKLGLPLDQIFHDVGPAVCSCLPLAAIGWLCSDVLMQSFPVWAMVLLSGPLALCAYLLTMRLLFAAAWNDIVLLWRRIAPQRLQFALGGEAHAHG
jgi:lipopolysaccharide exporter